MKYTPKNVNIDYKLFGILLTPSWLSGITVALMSVVLCLGTITAFRYQASSIRLEFLDYNASQITHAYQRVNDTLLNNTFLGNLPLLIFWGLVGLVVYLFAANIIAAVRETAALKSELSYVHANRRSLLWGPIEHLLVHLLVLVVWWAYILFFFHHVLPYCVAASIVGSAQLNTLQDSGYALLAIIVMAMALHIQVVLLRLLLLRPRIFSGTLYADID